MDALKEKLRDKNFYMWLYIAVMVPTYVLPYVGSNSILLGAASFGGTLPQFLAHLACLIALCVLAKFRGDHIGKGWIVWFPILAAIFDMVPLLSLLFFVPTVMHICALVIGMGEPDETSPDIFS
ncbi:MAG: hypothetical protein R3D89_08305 [Sphingomonadaceae bacterium]